MLTVGSLFAGIGGFDVGFGRVGMRTVWFCEQDEFCQRVLARHWPDVPCYPDVTQLRGADVEPVDVLCGGFPCQDISLAGEGAGIDGARSGLWSEYARLVGELRPRYVVVENVAALLARGLGRVLSDLAALGYDAEWDCIPASAVGAPHRRDRVWLVAYPDSQGEPGRALDAQQGRGLVVSGGEDMAHSYGPFGAGEGATAGAVHEPGAVERSGRRGGLRGAPGARDVADTERGGRPGRPHQPGRDDLGGCEAERGEGAGDGPGRQGRSLAAGEGEREPVGALQDADERALEPWRVGGRAAQAGGSEWWAVEPPVGRVAHGVPDRLDQLAALGNALVPQIAEWIGRRILDYEGGLT